MKVKNEGRIVWPKGVELTKDLQPGEEGTVLAEAEDSERVQRAIASGALSVVSEVKHVVTPAGIVATVDGDSSYNQLTGSPASGPEDTRRIRRSNVTAAEAKKLAQQEEPLTELEEFKRRKGGAKVKYIEEMTNVDDLREVLNISKGEKVLAAAEARIRELSGVPEVLEESLSPPVQAEEKVKEHSDEEKDSDS